MNQSWLRTGLFKVIGSWDSKIGEKRAALYDMQPEKYFTNRYIRLLDAGQSFVIYLGNTKR